MGNPEKMATQGTQDEDKQSKTQHTMCWTPLYTNKHKQRKQDMLYLFEQQFDVYVFIDI